MRILHRYIGRMVITSTILVMLILLGIETFIEFVGELKDIGTGDYGLLQALFYVPMQLPKDLYQLFPMGVLLGGLIGLGRLAATNELVIVRAAGVSKTRIMVSVLKTTLLMIVVVTAVGETVAPSVVQIANNYKAEAISGGQALHTIHGTWIRDDENFIHIDSILPGGHLQGITRYLFNKDHQLKLASYAKSADYKHRRWVFNQVSESTFYPNHVSSQHLKQQMWNVTFNPRILTYGEVDPGQQSLVRLYKFISYREKSGLQSSLYQFDFWKRVLQPLTTIVMMCLALSI